MSKLLPKKFGSRLFFMTFVAGLIPILIFAVLLGVYGKRFQPEIHKSIQKAYDEEWAHSEALLKKTGETLVRQKAVDVALQVDLTLQSHPYMDLKALQNDPGFRILAVQPVGETGFTSIYEAKTGVIRFHREPSLENKNVSTLKRTQPEFWSIMERSLGGVSASGYYHWKDLSGDIKENYVYIAPVKHKTGDGIPLNVAVVADVDEFMGPIKDAQAIHRTTAVYLSASADRLFRSFKQTGFLYMGAGICIISFMAWIVGIVFSRAITRLREATEKVNQGDFSVSVKHFMSGEVGTLTEEFNRMVRQLARTTVSKGLLEESEKRLIAANYDLQREVGIRELTEKALATEKEQLAVTLGAIGDAVVTANAEGKVILINEAAQRVLGWTEDDAKGHPFADIFHSVDEKTRAVLDSPVQRILEWSEAARFEQTEILIGKDGSELIVALSGSPIRDNDNSIIGVVIVFRDITEKRKMEEELLTVRKLESVDTLAGGIAHDFNNLLAVIMGNVSFAKMLVDPSTKIYERLTDAETATMRGKDLTYRLLTFSRGGEPLKKVTQLKELIKDSTHLSLSGSKVKSSFSIAADLRMVEIDEGQIRQVIHSVIVNAKEAMPDGGKVTIKAENVTLKSDDKVPLPDGDYVKISVKDQGVGIAEEDLLRVFDPYFTTKEIGNVKGMGLGLAICFSIIKNHNGYIAAESQLGSGTTLNIYLPAYKEGRETEAQGKTTPVHTGKHKILYMDDEDNLRDIAGRMLNHMGHEVCLVRDGEEAIAEYLTAMKTGKPFDVVIVDLTIPDGMGGVEALRQLREKDPQARVVVSSGYANDSILNDYKEYGFSAALAKPYDLRALCAVIDDVMAYAEGRRT